MNKYNPNQKVDVRVASVGREIKTSEIIIWRYQSVLDYHEGTRDASRQSARISARQA
jgi:hypothetical protein